MITNQSIPQAFLGSDARQDRRIYVGLLRVIDSLSYGGGKSWEQRTDVGISSEVAPYVYH
jgi:hypothetical protein